MKAKVLLTVLSVVVFSVFVIVFVAQAGVEPVQAVDNLIAAVNTGDLDQASALFAADAVASNAITDLSYIGSEEIGRFLQDWHHEDRTYDIVQLEMKGDTVHLTVDVSDKGYVWAQQRLTATVRNGMIQSLEVLETRLALWRILG